MPQSVVVPVAQGDHSDDHVTVSQCSNRTIPSGRNQVMPQSVVVPVAQGDHSDDHVTVSQCSNRTIPSEDETLPMLTPRPSKASEMPQLKTRPILKYTTRREIGSPFMKMHPSKEDLDREPNEAFDETDLERHQNAYVDEKIKHSVDKDGKAVFLPRLNDTELKQTFVNKRSIDTDYVRFPEISSISKRNGRLALNRSITDLLDPEMEILNKIKHVPRKKRKRRRKKFDCGTPV